MFPSIIYISKCRNSLEMEWDNRQKIYRTIWTCLFRSKWQEQLLYNLHTIPSSPLLLFLSLLAPSDICFCQATHDFFLYLYFALSSYFSAIFLFFLLYLFSPFFFHSSLFSPFFPSFSVDPLINHLIVTPQHFISSTVKHHQY